MAGILVVGVGAMGWNHARVCSEIGVLSGICDMDIESANKVAEKFAVPCFSTIGEAISELDPDGVIIATPTSSHHKIGMEVIESGVSVLVEKPISDGVGNAVELVEYAKERGVVLAVGHIERHNPVISSAKREIEEGKWGRVVTISTRRVSNFPGRIRDVGVILDLGIHDIDNAIYLMGSKPISVFARGGSLNNIDYEDHANLMIKFENGNTAVVEVNWITPMKVRTVSLNCEKAFVELDYMKQEMVVSSSRFADPDNPEQFPANIEIDRKSVSIKREEPLKMEILDFLQAIKSKSGEERRSPLVDGKQGIIALKVAIAALESIKSGEVVSVG